MLLGTRTAVSPHAAAASAGTRANYWPKYPETAISELGIVAVHRAQPLCGIAPSASYGADIARVATTF